MISTLAPFGTEVKPGVESDGSIQVADGLLEGDVIAIAGVWGLWLAELQAIKGGVGCADGGGVGGGVGLPDPPVVHAAASAATRSDPRTPCEGR